MTDIKDGAHSPLPWIISNQGKSHIVTTPGGKFIAATDYSYGEEGVFQANAAHIVKCVNSHDDLVDALREILRRGEDGMMTGCKASSIAEAALAKAGVTL